MTEIKKLSIYIDVSIPILTIPFPDKVPWTSFVGNVNYFVAEGEG